MNFVGVGDDSRDGGGNSLWKGGEIPTTCKLA